MVCPVCGVTIYSSAPPEQCIASHVAEQHPEVKPRVQDCPCCGEKVQVSIKGDIEKVPAD